MRGASKTSKVASCVGRARWRTCDARWFLRRCRRRLSSRFCGRRWRRRCLLARIADRLDLIEPLLLLINAYGEELDHGLSNSQPALQFMHKSAAAFKCQQEE